ncbi:MAG: 8-amino-7-oxononanoate synthase [Deferribacterota bacterium]|nr:8-amino-7-oxononanoate synthase [Deferribacterota bacterium]
MSQEIYSLLINKLKRVEKENLLRRIPPVNYKKNKFIYINGSAYLNCSSNDYLGLSDNTEIKNFSIRCLNDYGLSAGASRIVSGNYRIYDYLEEKMANFKGYDKCLVMNSGYTANLAIYSTLLDENSIVFSDELNHASIIDGIALSKAKCVVYKHRDIEHLDYLIKKYNNQKYKFIATDTLFSMDGDFAYINELVEIKNKTDCMLIADEAHTTGIYGDGRGYIHACNAREAFDINMGTFSKALGSFGAYICTNKIIYDYLVNKARSLIFTTGLPPAVVGANLKSIEIIEQNKSLYKNLINLSKKFRDGLENSNIPVISKESHIFTIPFDNNSEAINAHSLLLNDNIFATLARNPSVKTPRIRISLRSDFSYKDIDNILIALKKAINK